MFLKMCSTLPIQTIYHERIRVYKILNKIIKTKNDKIKFTYINDPSIKGFCTKNELNSYISYLDEQLYIYPKIAKLPEIIKDKCNY